MSSPTNATTAAPLVARVLRDEGRASESAGRWATASARKNLACSGTSCTGVARSNPAQQGGRASRRGYARSSCVDSAAAPLHLSTPTIA